MTSLEGWSSTIELRPRLTPRLLRDDGAQTRLPGPTPETVGAAGFEPAASCSQSRRAAKLRYAPSPKQAILRS
jgi:hypothetical protein